MPRDRRIIPDIVSHQEMASLPHSASVHDAVQLMDNRNIAAIAVTDGGETLVGIFTERDIVRRVFALGHNPQATPLSQVMTENPEVLHPNDLAHDAIELMLERGIRHLPVVNEGGQVLAMVSVRDLLQAALEEIDAATAAAAATAFAPEEQNPN